jgi:hypothetical protein
MAERNVKGWPAESTLRTGAPADVALRRDAWARRLEAKGEGEERLCKNMREKEKEGQPLKWQREIGRGERVLSCLVLSLERLRRAKEDERRTRNFLNQWEGRENVFWKN